MGLKKFEDYAKEFGFGNKSEPAHSERFSKLKNERVGYNDNTTIKKIKTNNSVKKQEVNESSFLVDSDYKVKVVVDIPQTLVKEYIDKVKSETDKNPLDNFSESEIAEQIVTFIIKKNLIIDNLTPEFTVGSESIGDSEKNKNVAKSDAENLTDDLGVESENEDGSDGEIEFKDFNEKEEGSDTTNKEIISDDEKSDGEIEFDENGTEEADLGEEREADKTNSEDSDSDSDSDFDEIEFDEESGETTTKPKTIGDLKKSQGKEIEKKHKDETKSTTPTEEEEEIEDIYKKIGYNVGYYESLKNDLYKKI